jgi:hypothetical protein
MMQKHWKRAKADISRPMAAEMRFLTTEGKTRRDSKKKNTEDLKTNISKHKLITMRQN